jgi:hypothetical protein
MGLGQIEKALRTIAGRLEAMERQPALTLTPASFRTEIDSVAHGAVSSISRPFIEAVQEARAAARPGPCRAATAGGFPQPGAIIDAADEADALDLRPGGWSPPIFRLVPGGHRTYYRLQNNGDTTWRLLKIKICRLSATSPGVMSLRSY